MSSRKQYSILTRARILEEAKLIGFSPIAIERSLNGKGFNVKACSISRILNHYLATTSLGRRPGSGRPSKISSELLGVVQKGMENNNEASARQLQKQVDDSDQSEGVSVNTIARARESLGWSHGRTRYCQAISRKNVLLRYEYAVETKKRMDAGYEFDDVIFTDESRIELDPHKKTSWRQEGGPIIMRGRHKHPLAVLVWAGISKRGATEILVFKGIMEADFYINDVLTKTFVNFANAAYGSTKNCVFMQDNDPKHTAVVTKSFMAEAGIRWVKTPAQSPDINPIEMLWAELKNYCRSVVKATTQQELVDGINEFWRKKVTPEKCAKYIDHLKTSIPKIIESKGYPTGE